MAILSLAFAISGAAASIWGVDRYRRKSTKNQNDLTVSNDGSEGPKKPECDDLT